MAMLRARDGPPLVLQAISRMRGSAWAICSTRRQVPSVEASSTTMISAGGSVCACALRIARSMLFSTL
jgi:hypothetical protein